MGKSIQEKIGIVGAGNLGTSMAISLKKAGFSIILNSSHYNNNIKNIKNRKNMKSFLSESDIILIAVKDKDIKAKTDILKNHNIKEKTIIHFSGYYSSEILLELKSKGAIIGNFHPIMSFPEKYIDIKKISENKAIFGAYEGDNSGKLKVKEIFEKLGFNIFEISKEDKSLYHLSLSIISNYPFYIVELGKRLFAKINVNADKTKLLNDFFEIAVNNYINSGKISGPLSRGDYELIDEEVGKIKERNIKEIIDDIIELSKRIKEENINES